MHTLLQPRPKPAQLSKGLGKGKGKDKNKTKTRADYLKDLKESAQLTAALKNLALSHNSKTLCFRYNRQSCNKQCKFLHACAIKLLNGSACGLKHPAYMHRFKGATKTHRQLHRRQYPNLTNWGD